MDWLRGLAIDEVWRAPDLSSLVAQQSPSASDCSAPADPAMTPVDSESRLRDSESTSRLPPDVERAEVEAWLDDHPDFTKDFFMRKATRQMIDAWLLSHAITQSLQESCLHRHATSVPGSRVTSGSVTPVRKISAHEFERGGTLKPIVSTVDGSPTFLTAPAPEPAGAGRRQRCRPRAELQLLDEKELIFELVKDICNDLDVCSLCHKILQSVSALTNADRCSLFLVRGEKESNTRHLVAQLFDVSSHSKLEETKRELRMPWGAGIAGFVAERGQTVNVADVYQDPRFNQDVDASTGYRTHSLLCMPIKDSSGEVLGVAQAVNKQGGSRFSAADEEVFASYLQFCGIGLRNAQLYERSQLENKRNEVLLDLARIIFEEQSTIERVVQRILLHALSFLQCQRCQVMLVDESCQGTFSRVFDIEADDLAAEDLESRTVPHEGRFPVNVGISGRVATTGRALNLADVYESPLFDRSVDEGSSLRHQSVLCLPIISPANRTIGVIQLVNKFGGMPFTKNDENFLEAFGIFCGISITNTHMYQKATTAVAKQEVTMEVLSYHATAPLEEAQRLQSPVPSARCFNLDSFAFDDELLTDDDTLRACMRMFLDCGLLERFRIDQLVFCRWLVSVKKNYRAVIYHNWRHAFNVCQMMYTILKKAQWWGRLGDLECLGLLMACLCHDLDHRGTNNSFQAKVSSPLAQLYGTSTMERHHFDRCVMILNTQGVQILNNLRPEEYSRLVKVVESAILSTDLAIYFKKRGRFFQLLETGAFDWQQESCRDLLRGMLMTACDVAAIAKPWPIQRRVAKLVASEFFEQGDIEKNQLHIKPMEMMDREKKDRLPDMQVDFIDSICMPVYKAVASLSPALEPLVDAVEHNRRQWEQLSRTPSPPRQRTQ
ncbi:dual 3',5'-cyclic-AMP and -GMP phosphodiesterase 11-like isoform X2 [Pollicipes pollicipes]|uniref:dual 3',5'-cyclic-AMP and -GMP phosphodiesterase 11-like isoform X2 n=1 Tax=Pollicipes pollicipes TaxID=41117 RepID=UPI001884E45E|nr:dual 3',5'-cyclic-AMP and -GMP phosphodiesterase 11-like isoform X2 [Pollicipes pollicipes]